MGRALLKKSHFTPKNRDCWDIFSSHCTEIQFLGATGGSNIRKLADATMKNGYLGIMVWYASVKNGLQYSESWDASHSPGTIEAYIETGKRFRAASVPSDKPKIIRPKNTIKEDSEEEVFRT